MKTIKTIPNHQELLSQREAAAILGLAKGSMYRAVRAGALTPVFIAGLARPRYRRSEVVRLARGEEPIR